jgi:hypothetical protein
MKAKIQQVSDYSLNLHLNHVDVTNTIRLQFTSNYGDRDERNLVDLHMTQEDFMRMKLAIEKFE